MGAVVLTVTGGEALYADMGHFGVAPIRFGWFLIVLPCLILNYAGQGALLLRDPTAISNPFYLLVPSLLLYPMIVLATAAAGYRITSINQWCIFNGKTSNPVRVFTSFNDTAYF